MESGTGTLRSAVAAGPIEIDRVRRLVLGYVTASTAFFFVSGLLGMLLRESQADLVRIAPATFYAIMTAHGLGAFVAWAAFAIMGVSFWVLGEVGFRMRPLGFALARITYWSMVIGVVGIVVTTLALGFGASWVFLYPLPFFPSGEWGEATTGVFAASVLLVGVSILTWCAAILDTVTGPGLGAPEEASWLNKLGCALGFGYLWPDRFRTSSQLPYAVIPLTVIGVDMIIATLPLAALLVEMIAQSIDPSVTIDAQLAKNLLWFFGHPVVYLLLFPAVSVYYLLIPRYAKKELVAGKVVALAWFVAVVVNVIVWAHHIYLDYPQGSIQGALNSSMQPLTYAIVLPSAISLYSLSLTIWRSDFQWTPAAKFLAAAMISWLVAGLSGIVNATIAFNVVIHNTMWIVGHFHNMALLNIGMVIFAAVYAFLPRLTGKEWYSESLSNSHLWLTIIGGYGLCLPMLAQGLQGAPRRYAVLPSEYDGLTQLTIPFVVMTALGQVIFAYNLIQTLRGRRREDHESALSSFGLTASLFGAAAFLAITALALDNKNAGETPAKPALAGGGANAAQTQFASSCGSCHTLSAAGTSGTVGPDLDQTKPSKQQVLSAIQNGGLGSGTMPPDLLTGADAEAVAAYVSQNAGK
ncbi:MAG: cbb3-type cytochrome c oxidase subunit I [Solirubrobacterales bacterium]